MRGFGKKKFSTWQVAGVLTVVLLGVISVSYAVSLNNFTPGTTISSTDVNTNFSNLNNALPGVNVYALAGNFTAVSSTASTVATLTVTAPSAGYVLVSWTGITNVSHTNGARDLVRAFITTGASDAISYVPSFVGITVPSAMPTSTDYYYPMASQRLFQVSAGANTFYVRADLFAGSTATIGYNELTGVFIPNLIGTPSTSYAPSHVGSSGIGN